MAPAPSVRPSAVGPRPGLLAAGAEIPAADLAFLVPALAGWWYAVPQMARMMHAHAGDAGASPEQALRRAATRLATPGARPDR